MSVSRPTVVQLLFSFAPVFQWCFLHSCDLVFQHVVLVSPHLCCIIGYICDLFVARNE